MSRCEKRRTGRIPQGRSVFSPIAPRGRGAGGEGDGEASACEIPLTPNPSPPRGEGKTQRTGRIPPRELAEGEDLLYFARKEEKICKWEKRSKVTTRNRLRWC